MAQHGILNVATTQAIWEFIDIEKAKLSQAKHSRNLNRLLHDIPDKDMDYYVKETDRVANEYAEKIAKIEKNILDDLHREKTVKLLFPKEA